MTNTRKLFKNVQFWECFKNNDLRFFFHLKRFYNTNGTQNGLWVVKYEKALSKYCEIDLP